MFFLGWCIGLNACQFRINKNASAIFTNDDFFAHTNVELTLWRNLSEATSAGITLHINNAKTVSAVLADALETLQQSWFDERFKILGLFAEFLLVSLRLSDNFVTLSIISPPP